MAAPQEKIWFVCITDHHEGPFTFAEVQGRVTAGELTPDSLAWKDGMADWSVVREIPELNALFQAGSTPSAAAPVMELAPAVEAEPEAAAAEEAPREMSLAERLAASQQSGASLETDAAEGGAPSGEQGINFDFGDPQSAGTLDLESRTSSRIAKPTKETTSSGIVAAPTLTAKAAVEMPAAVEEDSVAPEASVSIQLKSRTLAAAKKPAVAPAPAPAPSEILDAPSLSGDLDESEVVWMVKEGSAARGLFSYAQIREMSASGELAPQYLLWRNGWTDFKSDPFAGGGAASQGTQPNLQTKNITRSGITQLGGGKTNTRLTASGSPKLNPMGGGTRTGIAAPVAVGAPKKIFGVDVGSLGNQLSSASVMDRLKGLFKKKAASAAENLDDEAEDAPLDRTRKTMTKGLMVASSRNSLKNIVVVTLVLVGVGGSVGGFFLGVFDGILGSIPSLEDVSPSEYDELKAATKANKSEGIKFAVAKSKEEIFNPILYVTSNAEMGSTIHLHLDGKPGTLVNRISESVKAQGKMEGSRLVKFGPLGDGGKPMPAGTYKMKIFLENNEPEAFTKEIFIGQAGGVYESRMKRYQEALQKQFDAEVGELRQVFATLAATEKAVTEKLNQKNIRPEVAATIWNGFSGETSQVLQQVSAKLKTLGTPQTNVEIFYPYHIEMGQKLVTVLGRVMATHTNRLKGVAATDDPQDLIDMEWISSGLEQFPSRSATDKPLDLAAANIEKGISWTFPKRPEGGAKPVAAPAPAAPAATAPAAPAAHAAPVAAPPVASPIPAAPAAEAHSNGASLPAPAAQTRPAAAPAPVPAAVPAPAAAAPAAPAEANGGAGGLTAEELKALEGLR